VEHDLSDFEPSYRSPDAYLAVPTEERDFRTTRGSDSCRVRDDADTNRRYFLRALLPVAIRGEQETCSWGVWVEVSEAAYERARELWDAPATIQLAEAPLDGALANALLGYDGTLGLPGTMQLTGPTTPPVFTFAPEITHLLAVEQREGVYPERVLEWLVAHVH